MNLDLFFKGRFLSHVNKEMEKKDHGILLAASSPCLPACLPLNSPAHSKPNLREIPATASLFRSWDWLQNEPSGNPSSHGGEVLTSPANGIICNEIIYKEIKM